jgi:ABC-type polysaccharide/polyol phosphate transport system ATPase subunit
MSSIELSDVSVSYPIYSAGSRSLKTRLLRTVGGALALDASQRLIVEALSRVNLSIKAGERVGLLGQNGMGKSTLLKVLGGILEPSRGRVEIHGRVTALIDLGMGLDPEATGYENIIMRSIFLGSTFEEAHAKVAEVEEFSELGDYLMLPMRTYSTGMVARLAFAISTSGIFDILILDEHIGAADKEFTAKASARLIDITSRSKILAFASHDMTALQRVCNRGILLEQGQIIADAPIVEAIEIYHKHLSARNERTARQEA